MNKSIVVKSIEDEDTAKSHPVTIVPVKLMFEEEPPIDDEDTAKSLPYLFAAITSTPTTVVSVNLLFEEPPINEGDTAKSLPQD